VPPAASGRDPRDGAFGDAEAPGEVALDRPGRDLLTYPPHLRLGQPGTAVPLTTGSAIASGTVAGVVSVRADAQVRRVAARPVVAVMPNEEARGHRPAVREHPGNSVRRGG
jgi:hypothetical protein